ncbi:hypothetical protein AGOR_G00212570 [Albula goreensis]|uniref:Uncharacterized protein n=1 Tax=Albula goreensis TaxID=1534307 RepID=A0A8T3CMD5_9TELE|nr:hypothetical protein AGOR_G00212570 [Albula goreensis]
MCRPCLQKEKKHNKAELRTKGATSAGYTQRALCAQTLTCARTKTPAHVPGEYKKTSRHSLYRTRGNRELLRFY